MLDSKRNKGRQVFPKIKTFNPPSFIGGLIKCGFCRFTFMLTRERIKYVTIPYPHNQYRRAKFAVCCKCSKHTEITFKEDEKGKESNVGR